MKKTFSQKKSAFSLIELSIVLIIIGLLIAGVTGGASLIKSSELRSVMGESRAYATSINGFYTQFNALPGDFVTVIGLSGGGDGDGKIEYALTCAVDDAQPACTEGSNAWVQMLKAGVVDTNSVTATAPIAYGTAPTFAINIPSSKIKSSGWALDYRTTESSFEQNVIVLSAAISAAGASGTTNTLVNGTNFVTGALTPTDALSIDSKIDDGNAYRGKIRGVNVGNTSSVTTCYSTTAYATTATAKTCALSYQVDVNS